MYNTALRLNRERARSTVDNIDGEMSIYLNLQLYRLYTTWDLGYGKSRKFKEHVENDKRIFFVHGAEFIKKFWKIHIHTIVNVLMVKINCMIMSNGFSVHVCVRLKDVQSVEWGEICECLYNLAKIKINEFIRFFNPDRRITFLKYNNGTGDGLGYVEVRKNQCFREKYTLVLDGCLFEMKLNYKKKNWISITWMHFSRVVYT